MFIISCISLSLLCVSDKPLSGYRYSYSLYNPIFDVFIILKVVIPLYLLHITLTNYRLLHVLYVHPWCKGPLHLLGFYDSSKDLHLYYKNMTG